jgi:hypothetical protein
MDAGDVLVWKVRLLLLAAMVALLGLKNPALAPGNPGDETVEAASHVREIAPPVVTVSDLQPLKVAQPAVRSRAVAEPMVRMRPGNAARAVTSMKTSAAKGLTRMTCSPARSQAAARCAAARMAKGKAPPPAVRIRIAKQSGPGRNPPAVVAKSDTRGNARSS